MQCHSCGQVNDPGMRYCVSCGSALEQPALHSIDTSGIGAGSILKDTYEVIRLLGEGGAGAVYEGRHISLGHAIAVKVLFPQLARIKQIRDRFIEEGRIQANLRHANIVSVSDIVDEDSFVAIVMEYIKGPTLHTFIQSQSRPIPISKAAHIMLRLLAGLGAAHDYGVVHRDIKPGNIMLAETDQGTIPKICDFGIAKITSSSSRTITGTKMGTLHYMAPEQFQDAGRVDKRADIYSLGITFYEMLTGRLPFETENDYSLMRAHMEDQPPSLRTFRVDVPLDLDLFVRKSLAKAPDDRFSSCEEMAAALTAISGFETLSGFSSQPGVLLSPQKGEMMRPLMTGGPRRDRTVSPRPATLAKRAGQPPKAATEDDGANRPFSVFSMVLLVSALLLVGVMAYWYTRPQAGETLAAGDTGADSSLNRGNARSGDLSAANDGGTAHTPDAIDPVAQQAMICEALLLDVERVGADAIPGHDVGHIPLSQDDAVAILAQLEDGAEQCRQFMVQNAGGNRFEEVYAQTQADRMVIAKYLLRARVGGGGAHGNACIQHFIPTNRVFSRAIDRIRTSLDNGLLAPFEEASIRELGQQLQNAQGIFHGQNTQCL